MDWNEGEAVVAVVVVVVVVLVVVVQMSRRNTHDPGKGVVGKYRTRSWEVAVE